MALPGWFFPLRVRLLRPARPFPEGVQTHALRPCHPDGSSVGCAQGIQHVPLGRGARDHPAVGRRGDVVRDRVSSPLFLHQLFARHAAPHGPHHRQSMGGPQGETKAAEGRLRRTSGVEGGRAGRRQGLARGGQRPACAGEGRPLWGRLWARHMRHDVEKRRPGSGRCVPRETQATKARLVTVRLDHTPARLSALPRGRLTLRAQGGKSSTGPPCGSRATPQAPRLARSPSTARGPPGRSAIQRAPASTVATTAPHRARSCAGPWAPGQPSGTTPRAGSETTHAWPGQARPVAARRAGRRGARAARPVPSTSWTRSPARPGARAPPLGVRSGAPARALSRPSAAAGGVAQPGRG
jgi:hypothetical protein